MSNDHLIVDLPSGGVIIVPSSRALFSLRRRLLLHLSLMSNDSLVSSIAISL